jgi:hypothetical protein
MAVRPTGLPLFKKKPPKIRFCPDRRQSTSDDASRERTDHNDDMTDEAGRNVATVREYLAALQRGGAGEELREFFTEDVR